MIASAGRVADPAALAKMGLEADAIHGVHHGTHESGESEGSGSRIARHGRTSSNGYWFAAVGVVVVSKHLADHPEMQTA